jgi:hypothetical protein
LEIYLHGRGSLIILAELGLEVLPSQSMQLETAGTYQFGKIQHCKLSLHPAQLLLPKEQA